MKKIWHVIFIILIILLMNIVISVNGKEIEQNYEADFVPKNIYELRDIFLVQKQNKPCLFPYNSNEILSRNGMVGRLYIPEVSVNAAVFDTAELTAKERQYVVDLPDSAAMFYLGNQCVIGDHDLQGFQNIQGAIQGQTIAYMQKGNYTEVYICTEIGNGHNTGETITDKDGISVKERKDTDLIMYTCNGNWQNITYTVWEKISLKEILILRGRNKLCVKLEV